MRWLPFLGRRDRLVLAAHALDVHAPALLAQPDLALAVNVALVDQNVAIGTGRVEHFLEVQSVVLGGRAGLDLAHLLVAPIGADSAVSVPSARAGTVVLQYPQRIAQLVQLGFTFLVGRQTGLDHENWLRIGVPTSCHVQPGFLRCPIIENQSPIVNLRQLTTPWTRILQIVTDTMIGINKSIPMRQCVNL